jgi:hypothetical protein
VSLSGLVGEEGIRIQTATYREEVRHAIKKLGKIEAAGRSLLAIELVDVFADRELDRLLYGREELGCYSGRVVI